MPAVTRTWDPGARISLVETFGSLRRGGNDPALRVMPDQSVWWTTTTPDGVGTLHVALAADACVCASAWGPGAQWLLDGLPRLLGAEDDASTFAPVHDVVAAAYKRHRSWRPLKTNRTFEACIAAVVEQKVTGREARYSWRTLLARFGEPAPGPAPDGMFAPPPPAVWRQLDSSDFHRAGVTPQRARTVSVVAQAAKAIQRAALVSSAETDRVLRALPGVGVWTSAETRQRSHGDADAVSFADFHVAQDMCWWLTGTRGDDEDMRELLEPYAGHRYRVQRLMELSGGGAPRRGPRLAIPAHRTHSR